MVCCLTVVTEESGDSVFWSEVLKVLNEEIVCVAAVFVSKHSLSHESRSGDESRLLAASVAVFCIFTMAPQVPEVVSPVLCEQ